MKELNILADDKNMEAVNDFVHSVIPEDCPPGIVYKIDLAVEEIFVNIAHYAYSPNTGDAKILASFENGELMLSFCDRGKAFNPIEKKDPDVTLSAEERDIGGLGIFLTKKFMDSVEYEYKDGQNILTLRKRL